LSSWSSSVRPSLAPGVAVRLSCARADGLCPEQSCLQAERPDRVVSGFFSSTRSAPAKAIAGLRNFHGFGGAFMRTSAQSQGWAKAATAHGFAAITAETTAGHVAEDFDSLAFYLRQHAEGLGDRPLSALWLSLGPAMCPRTSSSRGPATPSHQSCGDLLWIGDVPQVRLDLPVLFVRAGLDQPLTINPSIGGLLRASPRTRPGLY